MHLDAPFQWAMDVDPTLNRTQAEDLTRVISAVSFANLHQCEVMVLATGFRSVVPGKRLRKRFPPQSDWYAAADNPNVHYVGWPMHRNDFRRGAGGFLAGFRYLIRNLVDHVREEDHGVPYPRLEFTKQRALDHAVRRFQVASDLVILQDGVVVRDAIVPTEDGGYHYYEGITYKFFRDFEGREGVIYLYFAWGDGRSAASVFDNIYLYNDTQKLRNIYLHPCVEVNGLVREAEEDLDMAWTTSQFVPPIKRIVRDAIRGDLSKFYPKPEHPYERVEIDQPKETPEYEKGKHPGLNIGDIRGAATRAILAGGHRRALGELRAEARAIMPSLIFPTKALGDGGGGSDVRVCVPPGDSCAVGGDPPEPCCGDGADCVRVPGLGASFCVVARP